MSSVFSAHSFPRLALILALSTKLVVSQNFKATFGESPAPFTIDVDPTFIKETVLKASLTRYAVDVEEVDLLAGPPRHNVTAVRDYWVNEYNWFDIQDQLNQRYKQFTTTVTLDPNPNNTDPIPLHFVHHRSNRTDAIPLLFLHGWPGSFMEVDSILDGLLNPPDASLPAFHVVAPSIPGFAFSPAPKKPGFALREAANAFNALMQQLNYTQYVIQGGDFGGSILRIVAGDYPSSVVSFLSNFWLSPPNDTDILRYSQGLTSADENTTIENFNTFGTQYSGYRLEMETQPLQVAIAMTDSPLGNAMWNYNLMIHLVDQYAWTPEQIITWSMMYYIQGPYGAMRIYKETLEEGIGFSGFGLGTGSPYVHQPVAISEFPADFWYGTPLDWARRGGNVVVRNVHSKGGHFAAVETPDLLLGDIRTFWGNASLSNVGVFAKG
ncbi:hypothetical protein MMC11_006259 [Xylographa trunciseda]|nr:hypothetical protein [Xylographa trunciseda]